MKHRSDNHVRGERWQKIHGKRYTCNCAKCGKHGQKSNFIALCVKVTDYDSHRILCRLCSDCLAAVANDLGVEIPN